MKANHMIMSINAENILTELKTHSIYKKTEENVFSLMKAIYKNKKLTANIKVKDCMPSS